MKALLVSAAAIGLLSAAPAFAAAGPLVSATGTADAVIVQPITVSQDPANGGGGMNFGKIAAIAGTVTINPDLADGTYSQSPNMVVDAAGIKPAHFLVGGENGLFYTPALASSSTTIDDAGAGAPMAVDLLLSSVPGSGHWVVGTDNFKVGGTLHVASGQASGAYTGTFGVTVQYN